MLPLCIWSVLENSLVHFAQFAFLLHITRRKGRPYLPLWLALSGGITWFVTFFQLPGAFFVAVLVLSVFARAVLHMSRTELAVPLAILFTLDTLREGCAAVFLSWAASNLPSRTGGKLEQGLTMLLLDALLIGILQWIQTRYVEPLPESGGLYLLTVPCAGMILLLRCGLRLDTRRFAPYLSALEPDTRFLLVLTMLGAAALVLLLAENFRRTVQLTQQKEAVLYRLNGLERARTYAGSAMQHDMKNHLLVLSGLIHEKQFAQAEQYAKKLYDRWTTVHTEVVTGRPSLDVLLKQKLSGVERSGIAVTSEINLPESLQIEDIDLCILFSNLLDNAWKACLEELQEKPFFRLSVKASGKLLLVEAVNPTNASGPVVFGTGLQNVQRIAERYHGTVETEQKDGRFRISVLLCAH